MKLTADWLARPGVQALFATITGAGHQLHAVGGCVRNSLLRTDVADIDFACSAPPETVAELAEAAGWRVLPTGIAHGTVTVLIDGHGYEITTWRKDVATDGRRATIAYAESLEDDAKRRDFTMNALYVSADGTITDPVGGRYDLARRRLRFIGDAAERIAEDYLRILRYFRFYAWYCDPEEGPDADALAAIASGLEGLAGLSAERVGAEMARLLAAPDPAPALALMAQSGALGVVLPGADPRLIAPLVHLEGEAGLAPRWQRRLAALGRGEDWTERLRLSRADARALDEAHQAGEVQSHAVAAYLYGADGATDAALIAAAMLGEAPAENWLGEIERGEASSFPLRAADLPHYQGRELGEKLRELEAHWLASDLWATAEQLLALDRDGTA